VLPALFPSFARGWGDAVARLGHRLGFRNAQAVEIWRSYRSLTDADSRRAFLRTMRSVIETGGQSVNAMDRLYLAEQTPTLIVWGGKDRIIPLAHAFQALEAMPNSRLEVFPGAGHFPQAEEPARFVEVLRDFLRTTEPSKFAPKGSDRPLIRAPADRRVTYVFGCRPFRKTDFVHFVGIEPSPRPCVVAVTSRPVSALPAHP
jgi:hypothetical protein